MTEYKCVVCKMPLLTTNDKWLLQNERTKSEWIARCVHGNCVMCQVWLPLEALDEIERLQQRIAELEQERRWIPVSEPPEENGRYIIAYEAIWDDLKLHTEYTDFVKKEGRWNALRVKYWQPLPQPPKERE